jgi:ATP-dependent Lon protease
MPHELAPRELAADEVDVRIDPATFGYTTTAELEPLDEIIGQPRAMSALDLGLGIRHPSYHIYIAGMSGTGKMETIRRSLAERVGREPTPSDWAYVNNFDEPDCPLAIELRGGQGLQLKREIGHLIGRLMEEMPKVFRREDFDRERKRIREVYQARISEIFERLQKLAQEKELMLQMLPDGQTLAIPTKDGKPISPDDVQQLSERDREIINQNQQKLFEEAGELMQRQQELLQKLADEIVEMQRSFAARLIEPLVDDVAGHFHSPKLQLWLKKLKAYLIANHGRFEEKVGKGSVRESVIETLAGVDRHERFLEFQVNLIVDNSRSSGAPVIIETAPNYRNLFGTIDRVVDRHGRLVTNFTRIKAGSLLRANGGYLVFNLVDALVEPFVWKELKRTLKSGSLQIEIYDPFSLFSVTTLRPEAIPLNVKIVALGNPLVYHLLYLYDEDFREVFKIKADFAVEMDRDGDAGRLYGRFLRKLADQEGLLPFAAAGVAEIIRTSARLAGDQRKLTAEFSKLADIAREASYWAQRDGASCVSGSHVQEALRQKVHRSDLVAAKIRELLRDRTLLVTLDGLAVGQVNGLAIADLGDYVFGWPVRITATTGVGAAGIINIERESRLSGKTFDKGMLILEGYLRQRYAREHPIALSASIAMEQSYGGVDGDSASAAELVSLLSTLANTPIRQDIAVTASVNQRGETQAVGGVQEKVEGYFDVCVQHGLKGAQGVCIPEANVKNLVLRDDVLAAIRDGRFHVWAVAHIDQVIAILSGIPAGDIDQPDTFHWRVDQRLREVAALLREQRAVATERGVPGVPPPPGQQPDPRPPLPGRNP